MRFAMKRSYNMMAFNQRKASPSYEEMGMEKPKPKEGRNTNKSLPIKIMICSKCKKYGGTLVKLGKGIYVHRDCLGEE
jgi:hypothetical protein